MRLLLPCKRHRIIIQLFGERLPENSLRASGRGIGHSRSNWICIQNSVDRKYCVYLSESLPFGYRLGSEKKEEKRSENKKFYFFSSCHFDESADDNRKTQKRERERERTKNSFLDRWAAVRTLIMENLMQLISNFLPDLGSFFFILSESSILSIN